jgi:cation diffusion facilitator family transporter
MTTHTHDHAHPCPHSDSVHEDAHALEHDNHDDALGHDPHVAHEHDRDQGHERDNASPHAHDHGQQDEHDHGHYYDDHGHDHERGHGHDDGHSHATGWRGFIESLISPHSHDAADKVDAVLESSSIGIRALKISLVGLMATAVLQLVVVLLSGSVALLADTIHNFADALTSVPLWIAFALARRAANRRYTYGYGKAEDAAGVIIVVIILGSALLAGWEAAQKILNPVPMTNLGIVAVAAVIGFVGNEAVAVYRIRTGKQIGSAALVADGYHARTDGLTSLAVLIGVIGTLSGFPIADPLVGLGITVAILLITKDAARTMWHRVMDAVDPGLIDRLEHAASHIPGVQSVHDVRARWLGHRLEADLRIVVDSELPTSESHAIAEQVRHALFHEDAKLASIIVHTDPSEHMGVDHHALTAGHTARFRRTR